MLVKSDRIPAKSEAEPTKPQLTAPITAAVPMVAIAVCATVLTALTLAALNHCFVFAFMWNHLFWWNFCKVLISSSFSSIGL